MTRASTHQPLTRREFQVAELVGRGFRISTVARVLSVKHTTALGIMTRLADKIPGDLPPRGRIMAWWRGAPIEVLRFSD